MIFCINTILKDPIFKFGYYSENSLNMKSILKKGILMEMPEKGIIKLNTLKQIH